MSIISNNSNNNIKILSDSNNNNHNHVNSIVSNSILQNNNFSNYSPISGNKLFKTAKISPRTSFPKKQDFVLSHRVNIKNKLQGNILTFYNNYKNNLNNNNNVNSNMNNGSMYGNSYNVENNNNKLMGQINNKKNKKTNISMNMNINMNNTYNKIKRTHNNFNKCSSLNKVKNNNYVENNYNFNYNNNINSIKEGEMKNGGNNIINNCQININNINYNYNKSTQNSNKIISERIYNLFNKKSLMNAPNNNVNNDNKMNKLIAQNNEYLNKNKNFTSNNSPINKNVVNNDINVKNKIKKKNNSSSKIENDFLLNDDNTNNTNNKSNQIKKLMLKSKDNSINNSKENLNINKLIIEKKNEKKENKKENRIDEYKKREKNKTNINLENKLYEILELKKNLQKNNSEEAVIAQVKNKNKKSKTKEKENPNEETISKMSSNTLDSNYYMQKSIALSKYIKEYYQKYNKYPNTDLNFYLYGRLIGQGAFGKVNIGLNILTGRVVAIKSFNKSNLNKNGDNMKKILYETNLMKKLNHPNITKILEMFEDDEYILIAMEYINGGNLFSFVKKRRKLSEKTAKFLFRQIILGIKYIHSQKIVHRDIKLENILIDLNNNIKICDFGIGRILSSKKQMLHDKCGTPMYMAPEILLSSKLKGYEGFPVDIWSSGISLYIMLSGTLPFNLKNNDSSSMDEENNNNIELQYSIINKEPKKIEKISDEARDLLRGLLNKNPQKRFTIEQILNHPWLKSDEKKNKNKKHHLFTKAEMIMLSKTYIDYRNGLIEDLKENFTISNLKIEKNNKKGEKKMKNITTKSSLLAPYNTLIQDNDSIIEYESQDPFDDFNNQNINLENDIIIINNKIKEYNLNYELNNNGECDNGMLINSKTGTISSSVANNSNIRNDTELTSRSRRRNENDDNDFEDEFNDNDDQEEEQQEKKMGKILNELAKIGYDKEYVLHCVNNNILCHASAAFYLMYNYNNI
jgi:non-specific serine/threonine protein kinase